MAGQFGFLSLRLASLFRRLAKGRPGGKIGRRSGRWCLALSLSPENTPTLIFLAKLKTRGEARETVGGYSVIDRIIYCSRGVSHNLMRRRSGVGGTMSNG
jgi:hypothetical protein